MNFANVTSLTIPEGSVKAIYCNDVKLWGVGGTYENTITGVPPLALVNCTCDDLVSWSIVGNTIQDGTPSPENPVDVQGVGDWDETEQKYKIPVKSNDTTTNIYLNSPLMTGETITSEGEREVVWDSYILDSSSQLTRRTTDPVNNYACNLDNLRKPNTEVISSHYVWGGFKSQGVEEGKITGAVSTSRIWVWQNGFNSLDEFKSWLDEQKANGTPVTVWYQVVNPSSETFTPPSIPTQSGTTVIDTDCVVAPSEMTVTFMSTTPQNEETR